MSDQDKDAFETGEPNEFMPGEDDFEEEFEGEEEEALEEAPALERRRGRAEAETGRRFRFGRGGGEEEEHARGSLRTSHERVHIDDRLSAVFVLVCAVGLIGILIGGFAGQYAPKGGAKPLPSLSLETFQASPTPVPSGSASLVPSASPSASPTAEPSAS